MAKKALFVTGGWPGHQPEAMLEKMRPLLEEDGFEVIPSDTLDSYTDEALMQSLSVVIQQWTMGELGREQGQGLIKAVRSGVGLAGWHGGLCDAFRGHTEYQFMTGGQWVAHPGNKINYTVSIVDHNDPITAGLSDFALENTEQYYMHVDPNNKVLATTRFTGEHEATIDGAIMPVVWKKMYGKGRIFYHSMGHNPSDLDVPEVMEMTRRGIRWASEGASAASEALIKPVYGTN